MTGPHVSFTGPVRTVLAGSINETFDLVPLAVKACGLDGAMRDMATAIGPATAILPDAVILVTVVAINFLGDGLQSALDPRGGGVSAQIGILRGLHCITASWLARQQESID